MRGLGDTVAVSTDPGFFESLWRDLFFDFDETSTIALNSVGTEENTRSLVVSYGPPEGATLPFGHRSVEDHVRHANIDFEYKTANREVVKYRPAVTGKGLSFGAVVESFPAILLSPVSREGPEHNGQRFSLLSKRGEHKAIVSVIRKQFPFIEDLSVEYHGGTAMVHAQLRSVHEKVPLPLVSDGINKMLSILLAAHPFLTRHRPHRRDGERPVLRSHGPCVRRDPRCLPGIEYPTVRDHLTVWSTCARCFRSSENTPDDFRLLRTTKDNGASAVDCFDGEHFAAALEEGLEIR